MKRKIINILLFLTPLLLTRCANQVAPTGGPKDTTPPKVTEASPANGSTKFDGNKIEIAFDEYITLNNASQQVLFSPPLTNKPDIKLNNKTVVIKLKEDLRPNTTYTIDFGEAIKDFHEGNIFKDYTYSFATGETLDTLVLTGKVVDVETNKPADNLIVGLYSALHPMGEDSDVAIHLDSDSLFVLPCRQAPDYIARTDKEGLFSIHGLPDIPFLVFALEDMNSNLYYDLPNEKVAFIDTLVCPSDSVSLTLSAFTEVDTTQMLLENKLIEEGLLRFVFRHPADSVAIDLNWPETDSFQMVQVWSAKHDTLCCWFTPNVLDSLRVKIQFDTLIDINKSFNIRFKETKTVARNKSKTLKINNNLKNKMLMPGEDFLLRFTEPVTIFHIDSLFEPADDYGMNYRLLDIVADTGDYALHIADSSFYSIRGRTNDSLDIRFKRAQESDLGNLYIQVAPPIGRQVVVQLLDNKDRKLDERIIDSTARVAFTQLIPGKYKLQAIIDTDRNGRWSQGNYHRRFFPEAIVPYKDELEIKAGWDIDLDDLWELR